MCKNISKFAIVLNFRHDRDRRFYNVQKTVPLPSLQSFGLESAIAV